MPLIVKILFRIALASVVMAVIVWTAFVYAPGLAAQEPSRDVCTIQFSGNTAVRYYRSHEWPTVVTSGWLLTDVETGKAEISGTVSIQYCQSNSKPPHVPSSKIP